MIDMTLPSRFDRAASRSALCLGLAALIGACGGSQVVDIPPPPKATAPPAPKPEAKPDAFRDFKGERVKPGEVFRLKAKAKAVEGVEVVIRMIKVEWTTGELPDGRKLKEGTAELVVQKGAAQRTTRVQQDDTKRSLGCKITVKAVGEDYDEQRMDYLPWVDLIVEPR